jgi:hypothetical protein
MKFMIAAWNVDSFSRNRLVTNFTGKYWAVAYRKRFSMRSMN